MKSTVLVILDGFGHRTEKEHNAIVQANTPCIDMLMKEYPNSLIDASGQAVGLSDGQMGSSEVGHTNIGAGRIIKQNITRISDDIDASKFCNNSDIFPKIKEIDLENKNSECKKAIHILALLSDGGIHSDIQHIHEFIKKAQANSNNTEIKLHAFLDGRDTPPKSAKQYIKDTEEKFPNIISSIIGRYYAMDRDNNWDRIQASYDLLTTKNKENTSTLTEIFDAIDNCYIQGETDEHLQAIEFNHSPIKDGDLIVCLNFRADRQRQLCKAIVDKNFSSFDRKVNITNCDVYTLTEYSDDLNIRVIYQPEKHHNILGEYISKNNVKQLRIAETEKYAHVTFFFNAGINEPFNLEDRILIPSPKVTSYDTCPEMSAIEITNELVKAIKSKKYPLIICNYANADMVGHTGNLAATVKAIECIDRCLNILHETTIECDSSLLITSDHGNAEIMYNNEIEQRHTAHTTSLVPLIYTKKNAEFKEKGILADIAPTILQILGLTIPSEMTGKPLLNFK